MHLIACLREHPEAAARYYLDGRHYSIRHSKFIVTSDGEHFWLVWSDTGNFDRELYFKEIHRTLGRDDWMPLSVSLNSWQENQRRSAGEDK
jgi:hypothetical protein